MTSHNRPDPALWKERLAPYEAEIRQSFGEDWTWTTGGCFAFAEAFHAAFGGEFYGLCRVEEGVEDFAVDHALVMLDDVLYDHDGPFDTSKIRTDQVIKHRDEDYVFWFEDDFFHDEGWEAIHIVLRECAAAAGYSKENTGTRAPGMG